MPTWRASWSFFKKGHPWSGAVSLPFTVKAESRSEACDLCKKRGSVTLAGDESLFPDMGISMMLEEESPSRMRI